MFALFFVAAAMAQNVASKKEREACPFWVATGVLTDAMEIVCEEGASNPGERFDPTQRESVALACCPRPYQANLFVQLQALADFLFKHHQSLTILI